MKKFFYTFFALVATTSLWAGDVIYYRIIDDQTNEVEVTFRGSSYSSYSNEYSGSVTIPATITYNGTTYNVTRIGDNAFRSCSSLTAITIPNSVTSIGDNAFKSCSGLKSVTFGNGVTSIGDEAFYGCSGLTSVTIPNSVTSIGIYAFYSCSGLTSITIPNSVTSIGNYAFYSCSGLTSITIPNSVMSIGSSAFYGCSGLTSVVWNAKNCADFSSNSNSPFYIIRSQITSFTFGESVQHIPAYLCWGLNNIPHITFPNNVTTIGRSAFYYCSCLKSVTFGNGVTRIGDEAFGLCGLTSISIPNSVTSIGDNAFYYCSKLTSIESLAEVPPTLKSNTFKDVSKNIPVYVPCGSVSAYESAEYWKKFTNIQEPLAEHSYSIVINVNDNRMGTAKVDKNSICGAQISATPNYGYHFVQWSDGNKENPRTLELTQDITLTAEFAQTYSGQCGDNLYWSFNNNTLTITGSGDMWDKCPWGLFDEETKTILFPNDITYIGDSAFSGFKNLTSITIPNSVEGIGGYAFQGCSNLTSITIPNSVEYMGKSVFDGCSCLTSIIWNAKSCGFGLYDPFNNIRSQITSFTFGNDVQDIPADLCRRMSNLTSITIPNSVKSIGNNAFEYCSGLTSITIPNGVTSFGDEVFSECEKLNTVTIGNSITRIGESSFWGCKSLTSITIPNSVTGIGYGAFGDCIRLGQVSMGTGISYIASDAFYGCNRLYDIYCYATNPPTAKESSFAIYSNVNLYVPCESKEDYEYDPFWSKFKFIECNDVASAVDDIQTAPTNVQKFLRNDMLIIIRDGVEYNAMGQEL